MNERNQQPNPVKIASVIALIAGLLLVIGLVGCPKYNIYSSRAQGEALLAHAQSAKEVAVSEAKAKMESAELLAQAEVIRAKGVAAANAIIGQSLKDNEAYLRYLWITDVAAAGTDKTVIYIPTEANLPVLEASRLSRLAPEKK